MDKKEYISPEFDVVSLTLKDVILGSPEDFNGYLSTENDDLGDLDPDPDDGIDW